MGLSKLLIGGIKNPLGSLQLLRKPRVRRKLGQEMNKWYHSRGGSRNYNTSGIDIFSEDWDNLIILDACRHDYFQSAKEKHGLPGKLESRISRGSQTPEWLWANFHDRTHYDTVYITASTMPYHLGVANPDEDEKTIHQQKYSFQLQVHELINIWANPPEGANPTLDENGEGDYIVPASLMADKALQVAEKYPNKRVIIHLIEPHDPYLASETGKKIHKISKHPWQDRLSGDIDVSIECLRQAYRENVDIGIEGAKTLINGLEGKTVVSADHGEMLWDRSFPIPMIEILHPDKMYVEELVRVPWLIVDGERREIVTEQPNSKVSRKNSTINDEMAEQLEALGYK